MQRQTPPPAPFFIVKGEAMEFAFSLPIDLGSGWSAGLVEGVLHIEPDPVCNPAEPEPDWTVSEIHLTSGRVQGLDGSRVLEQSLIELDSGHWLHEPLLMAVIERCRQDIDAAWASHIRGKIENARRAFVSADPRD